MRKKCIVLFLALACSILAAGCTQTAPAPAVPVATTPPASVPAPTTAATPAVPVLTAVPAVQTSATALLDAPGYVDLTPAEAKDLMETEKDLVIIDVSPYYGRGHLPGAISIPLSMLDEKIPSLDRKKTYLVYCHADGPSISGARKLVSAGFPNVYRLAGNYAAWTAAGYPVEI